MAQQDLIVTAAHDVAGQSDTVGELQSGGRLTAVFFFKQKTAYEIVSGDWSSDVCSSDHVGDRNRGGELHLLVDRARPRVEGTARSEERRVGEECLTQCRFRWSPDHLK